MQDLFGINKWEAVPSYVTGRPDPEKIQSAFNSIGLRVKAEAENNYILTYCSPSRKGNSSLTANLYYRDKTVESNSSTINFSFSADTFTGSCTPDDLVNPCKGKCGNFQGLYCGPCTIDVGTVYSNIIPARGVLNFIYVPSTNGQVTVSIKSSEGTTPPFLRLQMKADEVPTLYFLDASVDADLSNSIKFDIPMPVPRVAYNFVVFSCSSLKACQTNEVDIPVSVQVVQAGSPDPTTAIATLPATSASPAPVDTTVTVVETTPSIAVTTAPTVVVSTPAVVDTTPSNPTIATTPPYPSTPQSEVLITTTVSIEQGKVTPDNTSKASFNVFFPSFLFPFG
jgi:hypothetical protein